MLKLLAPREESEWVVRVSLQLFHLSEAAFSSPGELENFKTRQMSLVERLRECRAVQLELNRFIEQHKNEVESGEAAIVENGRIHLTKDAEPALNSLFTNFISTARTVLYYLFGQKDKPDSVTYLLIGESLSFVQAGTSAAFESSAAKFLKAIPTEKAKHLIDMLRTDRDSWSTVLIGTRNRLVHDVDCPRLTLNYGIVGGIVRVAFPTVSKTELRTYANLLWENHYQTVEDTVVLCLNMRMPENIVPSRIPDELVNPKLPFRWSFAFRQDQQP